MKNFFFTLQDRFWNHFMLNSQKANQRLFSPRDNSISGQKGGQGHVDELIVNWKVIAGMSVTVCEASWPASSVRRLLLLELKTCTMRKKIHFSRDHFLSLTPMRAFLCRDASKSCLPHTWLTISTKLCMYIGGRITNIMYFIESNVCKYIKCIVKYYQD